MWPKSKVQCFNVRDDRVALSKIHIHSAYEGGFGRHPVSRQTQKLSETQYGCNFFSETSKISLAAFPWFRFLPGLFPHSPKIDVSKKP